MDFTMLLSFFGKELIFSAIIILLSFILGWLLYNHVVTRKICLKDALFEKDNLAAWVEFIGAFVFPALFLAAKAVEGPASQSFIWDLSICSAYAVTFIVLLTLLRLLSGVVIAHMSPSDQEGKVSLNNEIYSQNNVSASLFSISLSVIFISLIRFLDIDPEYFTMSLLKVSSILIFTLVALIVYCLVLRYKTTLFKEIFVDNNIAAGTAFLGFVFAIEMMLSNSITQQVEFNYFELMAFSFISLAVFGVLSLVFKFLFSSVIKVDIWNEVYEQNNIGAALGQCALYIGIASVITHFIK